jgi:ketosteroid isomerase-like protein
MLYDRSNQTVIRNPFMQAIEFRGGKVAKMRDYCDGSVAAAPERKPATGSRL